MLYFLDVICYHFFIMNSFFFNILENVAHSICDPDERKSKHENA